MKHPTIWQLHQLVEYVRNDGTDAGIEVKPGEVHWFPARPLGFASIGQRFKAAWLVFTGRADAVSWPFQ